jgi:hypothetical protein
MDCWLFFLRENTMELFFLLRLFLLPKCIHRKALKINAKYRMVNKIKQNILLFY